MKNMVDKVVDSIFPTLFGASGGIFGVTIDPLSIITINEIIGTALSAAIFAVIGGVIGYYINKLLKKIDK